MISAVDVLCVTITIALIAVEGQRGLALSLVDLVGALLALAVAGLTYDWAAAYIGSYSTAYLVCWGVPTAAVVAFAVYVSVRTKEYVRGWESAAGAFVGLCTGVVVAYGIYNFLLMRYGIASPLLKNSLLAYQFDEHGVVYEMTRFVRTLMGR